MTRAGRLAPPVPATRDSAQLSARGGTGGETVPSALQGAWDDFNAWIRERDQTPAQDDPRWVDFRAKTPPPASQVAWGEPPLVSRDISQRDQVWHRRVGSVASVEVYKRDVRIVRRYGDLPQVGGGHRGCVDAFSAKSRRRLKFAAGNSSDDLVSQFCLTWHELCPDGETTKKRLNTFLTWLRRNFPGVSYLWILEFQARGFPHFHLFTNIPADAAAGAWIGKAWNRITKEGGHHLWWHSRPENFISWEMRSGGYLTKYLDKEAQKHVPEGFGWVGRFWGASRSLVSPPLEVTPEEIRELYHHGDQRDPLVVALRFLDRYQRSQWRRYKTARKPLLSRSFSCSVSSGAAVFWAVLEYMDKQRTAHAAA